MEKPLSSFLKITSVPTSRSKPLGQNGFALGILLGLLPILISMSLGVLAIIAATQTKMIPLQICRGKNLQLQETALHNTEELLRMNPPVNSLRAEKKLALGALAAAIVAENPIGVIKAKKWLERIKISQTELKVKQLALLAKSSLESLRIQKEMKVEVEKHIAILSKKLAPVIRITLDHLLFSFHKLAVRPDLTSDEPAIYERVPNYSEEESAHASWKTRYRIEEKNWLANFLKINVEWRQSCRASLFEDEQKWKPKLLEAGNGGKYSSNL